MASHTVHEQGEIELLAKCLEDIEQKISQQKDEKELCRTQVFNLQHRMQSLEAQTANSS